jgi:hypothetical protein
VKLGSGNGHYSSSASLRLKFFDRMIAGMVTEDVEPPGVKAHQNLVGA